MRFKTSVLDLFYVILSCFGPSHSRSSFWGLLCVKEIVVRPDSQITTCINMKISERVKSIQIAAANWSHFLPFGRRVAVKLDLIDFVDDVGDVAGAPKSRLKGPGSANWPPAETPPNAGTDPKGFSDADVDLMEGRDPTEPKGFATALNGDEGEAAAWGFGDPLGDSKALPDIIAASEVAAPNGEDGAEEDGMGAEKEPKGFDADEEAVAVPKGLAKEDDDGV
jgi:hypothetical protein